MDEHEMMVRTLPDNITNEDELGSHQKIADKIAELINSEEEGKTVALTGTWGSGKSSIIEMQKRNFDQATSIFLFDAWAHERDPLRRSFLEQLIDFLSSLPVPWIENENYKALLDRLSKREESANVTYSSKPTLIGYIVTGTAFFVPIGIVILSRNSDQRLFNIPNAWGLIPAFLPIITALIIWGFSFLCRDEKTRTKWRSYVTSDFSRNFESKTYKTPDPTTIEFHRDYKLILKDALDKNDRKLVLVIDNLDRLDNANALAMWAAMKTFLDFSALRCESWSKRLWLIVPFDPGSLKRLWSRDRINLGEEGNLANSFIDKTFQLSFHVPVPVLSNWVEYFKNKLQWALPKVTDKEVIHTIYRIFRLKKFRGAAVPTPREIKIFINRIGTIYRIRHDDIPLSNIALYAALENDGRIDIERLQKPDDSLIEPISIELIGWDYKESLAAIYFNVPREQALHVLLGPKLEDVISKRHRPALEAMSTGFGFVRVLEEIVEESSNDWAKESPSTIAWLASRLDDLTVESDQSLRHVWNLLCRRTNDVRDWKFLDEDTGWGIARLIDHRKSNDFAKCILSGISNMEWTLAEETKEAEAIDYKNWLGGCLKVLEKIEAINGTEIIENNFRCPGDSDTYFRIATTAAGLSRPSKLFGYLKPNCDSGDVIYILSDRVSKGKYDPVIHDVVLILRQIREEWEWEPFMQTLNNRVNAPNTIDITEMATILNTLIEFSAHMESAANSLQTMARNGHCFHHFQLAFSKNDPITVSLCLYVILKYNPSASIPAPAGNSQAGIQNYNNIKKNVELIKFAIGDLTELIVHNNDMGLLFNELQNDKSLLNLRHSIIEKLCDEPNLPDLIPVAIFKQNEADFYMALRGAEKYRSVVDTYVEKAGLIEEVMGAPFDYTLASLYGAILKSKALKDNKIESWVVNGLRGLAEDVWKNEFSADYDNLFDLIIALEDKDLNLELTTPFREALDEYKNLVMQGKEPEAKLSKDWPLYVRALAEDIRISYIDRVIDDIIESPTDISILITLFGESLMDCDRLVGKNNEIIQKGFDHFYDGNRIPELKWFLAIIRKCPDFLKKARKPYIGTLKNFVQTKLRDNKLSDEVAEVLTQVGEELGIRIEHKENELPENPEV